MCYYQIPDAFPQGDVHTNLLISKQSLLSSNTNKIFCKRKRLVSMWHITKKHQNGLNSSPIKQALICGLRFSYDLQITYGCTSWQLEICNKISAKHRIIDRRPSSSYHWFEETKGLKAVWKQSSCVLVMLLMCNGCMITRKLVNRLVFYNNMWILWKITSQ